MQISIPFQWNQYDRIIVPKQSSNFTIMQNTCCTSSQSYRIQVAHRYNHIEYMLHIFTIMQNACCTSSQSYRIHVARIIPNHIFFSFFYTCNKCTCTSWWTANMYSAWLWRCATCILYDCKDVQPVFCTIVKTCNMYSAWLWRCPTCKSIWLWRRATCSLYDCEDKQHVF
jgi:hypothetical protein